MELAGEQPVQVLKFLKVLGKAFMTRLSRIGSSVMYSFENVGDMLEQQRTYVAWAIMKKQKTAIR